MSAANSYRVLSDGWIKIDRSDFEVGLSRRKPGRLLLGLNQLLLTIGGKHVLVDTGLGEKWSKSELGLLDFQRPRRLMFELREAGVTRDRVDVVILTHLHYDHSGGGTVRQGDSVAPTFPNAVYYVQSSEMEFAVSPPLERADDYKFDDFGPLVRSGQLVAIDGDQTIVPGVSVHLAPGHSPGHQVVLAELSETILLFSGDLFSTRSHANLNVTMTYDLNRATLLREREKWLMLARKGAWQIVFCHAMRNPVGVLLPLE